MLILDNDDVAAVLTMPDVVATLEAAYADLSSGAAICRPRIDMRYPIPGTDQIYQWGSMEGGAVTAGYHAIRMKTDVLTEIGSETGRTQQKHCVRPGLYCGLVLLTSTRTGEPLALLNDGLLQHMRVGADSAIGINHAAREEAHVLGMLGSGGMARSHLEAILAVRPINLVRVYSPARDHRERYAEEMSSRYGVDVVPADSPHAVFEGVDIVAGCTDAADEVIIGEWLEPGTHIVCVGGRLDRAAHDVIDVWLRLGTAPAPRGHPEWRPDEEYIVYAAAPQDPVWDRHTHGRGRRPPAENGRRRTVLLEDLLLGREKARTTADQVTFSERGNIQGAQFYAIAGLVYERALERGLGHAFPTPWLLQDIRD